MKHKIIHCSLPLSMSLAALPRFHPLFEPNPARLTAVSVEVKDFVLRFKSLNQHLREASLLSRLKTLGWTSLHLDENILPAVQHSGLASKLCSTTK